AALMPLLDRVEDVGWKPREDAVIACTGTDRVHGDPALRERDREVADQRFLGRLRRSHGDPRLPTAFHAPGGIGDGKDASVLAHQRNGFTTGYEEFRRLR